jgi:hypothetical protein
MKYTAIITALLIAVSARAQVAPPLNIAIEAQYQQRQELQALELVQGANVNLRVSLKSDKRWLSLEGLTARFDGRASETSTTAVQRVSTSTVTNVTPNYFDIRLNSDQTGTAFTNWLWSIIVSSDGTNQYPLGYGTLDIPESSWTGPAAVMVTTNAMQYTDAAISNHAAVVATSNILGHVYSTDFVEEAPIDGSSYFRKDAGWTQVITVAPALDAVLTSGNDAGGQSITNATDFETESGASLTNTAATVATLGTAAFTDATNYATAAQGALADTALQAETDTLQSVVDRGGTITNGITSASNTTHVIRAAGSDGILIESNNGTDAMLIGAGGGAGITTYDGLSVAGALTVQGTNVMQRFDGYVTTAAATAYVLTNDTRRVSVGSLTSAGNVSVTGAVYASSNVGFGIAPTNDAALTVAGDLRTSGVLRDTLTANLFARYYINPSTGKTWMGNNRLRYYPADNQFERSSTAEKATMIIMDEDKLYIYNQGSTQSGKYSMTPTVVISGTTASGGGGSVAFTGAITGATVTATGVLTAANYSPLTTPTALTFAATNTIGFATMEQWLTVTNSTVMSFSESPVDTQSRRVWLRVSGTNSVSWPTTNLPHFAWSTAAPTGQPVNVLLWSPPSSSNVYGRVYSYE